MIRFFKYIVIILAAIVLLAFAYANHQFVTVSFDPFGSDGAIVPPVDAPLFVVVIVSAMLGVIAGAAATWLSQGRHRKAARRNRAEADKWRAQAERLREAQGAASPHLPLPRDG
jgi:uncharacterized integral membrane protein